MDAEHKLSGVLVVATVVTYVALALGSVGETEGIAVGKYFQLEDDSSGHSIQQILINLSVRLSEVVVLAILGSSALGFHLRGPAGAKENACAVRTGSFTSLLGLNFIVWRHVIFILKHTVVFSDDTFDNRVGLTYLAVVLGLLVVSANVAVVVQMFFPEFRRCSLNAPITPDEEIPQANGGCSSQGAAPSEPVTPPYVPNLFRTNTDPCDICSMDFNSWRSQRPPSTQDSFDDCFETVFDGNSQTGGQLPRRLQVVKSRASPVGSYSSNNGRTNICKVGGAGSTLFMGALNEDARGGLSKNSRARFPRTPAVVKGVSAKRFLPHNSTNVDENQPNIGQIVKEWVKSCWQNVREEKCSFRFSVWIKAAGLVCSVVLVYSCISAICTLQKFSLDWVGSSGVTQSGNPSDNEPYFGLDGNSVSVVHNPKGGSQVSFALGEEALVSALGTQEGRDEDQGFVVHYADPNKGGNVILIQSVFLTKLVHYIDSVMDKFFYTVVLGYVMSTFVGFWSLYYVFARHKNLIMKLNHEEELSCHGDICLQQFWRSTKPKYTVTGSVYFVGTLASTAVIQQHLLGFFLSALFAVIANVTGMKRLADIGGTRILSVLGVLLLIVVLTHFVGNYVLSDGLQLKHPRCFFLFVFALSLGNFVLGALHGFYRFVFLLVSTFVTVSRLDVSSFQSGRGFDNGHNTFMSMVLLTHKIQEDVRAPVVGLVEEE